MAMKRVDPSALSIIIMCYMCSIMTIVVRNYYQQLVNLSMMSETTSHSGQRIDSKQGNKLRSEYVPQVQSIYLHSLLCSLYC